MLYGDLDAAIERSGPGELPEVTRLLWQAFAAGAIDEDTAGVLSTRIEARLLALAARPPSPPRLPRGSRPRSSESIGRRRRWAASGWMPPQLAARFTLAEMAALAVIAAEASKRGDCRLPIGHVAAVAGVGRSSVKRALREARALGLITIEERRLSRWRNAPNVVRIADGTWSAWLRMRNATTRPPGSSGGGVQTGTGTNTGGSKSGDRARWKRAGAAEGQGRSRAMRARAGCG